MNSCLAVIFTWVLGTFCFSVLILLCFYENVISQNKGAFVLKLCCMNDLRFSTTHDLDFTVR